MTNGRTVVDDDDDDDDDDDNDDDGGGVVTSIQAPPLKKFSKPLLPRLGQASAGFSIGT